MFTSVPIQDILFTVFQSIFQVFLLCLAGFALSFKGIVDKPTSQALNHLNVALFTPALLFSKVAFFLSPAKLRQLWIIPIFFTLLTILSAFIAHSLARAFRLKRSQVNFATAASMFMNSNSLPVALMQSLATTVPLLKWGPDDTLDAMFGRSLTYLVVFSTLGMILRWSYGVRLLSRIDEPDSPTLPASTYRDDDTGEHPELASDHATVTRLIEYEAEANVVPHARTLWHAHNARSRLPHPRHAPLSRRHTHPYTRPHSHLPAVPTSLGDHSDSDESDEVETTEGESSEDTIARYETIDTGFSTEAEDPAEEPHPTSPKIVAHPNDPIPRWDQRALRSSLSFSTRLLNMLTSLSPPLVASVLALIIVLIPPMQRVLNSTDMIPFRGALDSAGGCSVPLTMIVLGGWFWDGETKAKSKGRHAQSGEVKGTSDGHGETRSKGKGIEEPHDRGCLGEGQDLSHASNTDRASARLWHREQSWNSSTASLSSIIGAFGDVLMAHVYPRGSSRRASQRARVNTGPTSEGDVEQGRLETRAQTDNEHAENGFVRSPRPRSRSELLNGRARPSLTSTTPQATLSSTPKSAQAQGANPPGETLTVVVTILARMVIVPIVVTPLMVLVNRMGWGGEVFEDPVFIVSSMLLVSSPPALTLAQISQRVTPGTDTNTFSPFERLLSRTVFWAYLVLTPPVMIASVMVGLLIVEA